MEAELLTHVDCYNIHIDARFRRNVSACEYLHLCVRRVRDEYLVQ